MCDFSLKELRKEVSEAVQETLEVVLQRELTALQAAIQAAIKADFQDHYQKSLQSTKQLLASRSGVNGSRRSSMDNRRGVQTMGPNAFVFNNPASSKSVGPEANCPATASWNTAAPTARKRDSLNTVKRMSLNSISETDKFRRKSIGGALLDTLAPTFRGSRPAPVPQSSNSLAPRQQAEGNWFSSVLSNGSQDPRSRAPTGAPPKLHVPSATADGQASDRCQSAGGSVNGSRRGSKILVKASTMGQLERLDLEQVASSLDLANEPWAPEAADSSVKVQRISEAQEPRESRYSDSAASITSKVEVKPKKDAINGLRDSSPPHSSWDVETVESVQNQNFIRPESGSPQFSEGSLNLEQVQDHDGTSNGQAGKTHEDLRGSWNQQHQDKFQGTKNELAIVPTVVDETELDLPLPGNLQDVEQSYASDGIVTYLSEALEEATRPGPCRGLLLRVVQTTYFDFFATSMVILNSAVIGAQTDWQIHHINEPITPLYRFFEAAFCIIFSTELSMRLLAYGFSFFTVPEWKWNVFDTMIVLLQLMEEVAALITDTANMPSNFNFVRILRILRLVRIMRLVRLLRFIQELRTMVCSIGNCLKSLFWTLVLLFLMIYVMSVYITQMIADHGEREILEGEAPIALYWSSLARAVLSLFQGMTGGVDWDDLISPLMEEISPLTAIVFSLYIAFAVLAMMNVVTGIFVESALLTAKADKEAEIQSHVRKIFKKADKNTDGMISWEEFTLQLSDPGLEKYFKVLDIDIAEARGLFLLLDTDESGTIDAEEFVMGILRLRGAARAIDLSTLMYFNKRMMHWWTEWRDNVDNDLSDIIMLLADSSDLPESNNKNEEEVETTEVTDNNSEHSSGIESTTASVLRRRSSQKDPKRKTMSGSRHHSPRDTAHFATWADLNREAEKKAVQLDIDRRASDGTNVKLQKSRTESLKVPEKKNSKSVRFGMSSAGSGSFVTGFFQSPRNSCVQMFGAFNSRGSDSSILPMETPVETEDGDADNHLPGTAQD